MGQSAHNLHMMLHFNQTKLSSFIIVHTALLPSSTAHFVRKTLEKMQKHNVIFKFDRIYIELMISHKPRY